MKTEKKSILVVDDDVGILESFDAIFGDDHPVLLVDDGRKAKKILLEHRPELVFLDLKMPGMSGFEVLEWMRQNNLHTEVVVITALPQDSHEVLARRYGVSRYLRKPFDLDEVESLARHRVH